MKKYLVVALAALFVLGFAASSFAIHAEIPAETQAVVAKSLTQITIGGFIRVRGDYRANTRDFNNDSNGTNDASYFDEKVQLSVEAKVTPNTTGLIQLETSGGSADNVIWGQSATGVTSGVSGSILAGNQKQGGLYLLQAWILHQGTGLLGVPALVKVGHMPITVGGGLFYNHDYQGDDALLLGVDPVKGLHVIGALVKESEGNISKNDDISAYSLITNYDIAKDSSIGIDITYADAQNQTTPAGLDIHLWNIGLNGKYQIGGLGLYGEGAFQTGKVVDIGGLTPDQKIRAYAAKLGATYMLAPVKLGVEAAYGSGNDATKDDNKIRGFMTSQGTVQHYTYVYDYRTLNAAGIPFGGLQNTWYLKASGAADITKALSGELAVYYLRAVNDYGKAISGSTTPISKSKAIGTEVDAKANYKIDRNLNYFVEAGYLFAGNFWNNVTTKADHNADDAWVVRHGIQLAF